MVSNQTIHLQKMNAVIIWLARFGYSTRKMLCLMLDIKIPSSTRFFNKMVDNGFIKMHSFSPSNHKIVMLTDEGYEIARFLLQDKRIIERRRLSFPNIMHSYSIQSFLVSNLKNIDSYLTEMDMAQENFYRRPDLIFNSNGESVAVEVELNQKTNAQIEYNYMQHIRDTERKRFDYVIYLFSSEGVKDKYEQMYKKDSINTYESFQGKLKKVGVYNMNLAHEKEMIKFFCFDFDTI